MRKPKNAALVAACLATFTFSAVPAAPVSAEIVAIGPGAMMCQNGFVHVEIPGTEIRGDASDYVDAYVPVLQYLAPGGAWTNAAEGDGLTRERYSTTWKDKFGVIRTYHEFDISNPQKGHYWRVVQYVRDGETGRFWETFANIKGHDPDYCDATGRWE